jgi:GNAT superfamily N-acetyltransferase
MAETFAVPSPPEEAPRRPHARELPQLHAWLDVGLRAGAQGRLAVEYPLTMGETGSRRHQVVYDAQRPVAHAMCHAVMLRARGRRLRVGMIGNVYTDPAFRSRGLAGACVEAALAELHDLGASLAILWGKHTSLYDRLGFAPAGREVFWNLATARAFDAAPDIDARPLRGTDLPALESLHAAKPVRVERRPGDLRALCSAPDTQVAVAQRGTRVEGYAVAGRGDDFTGIVHEWAGSPEAVARCVSLLRERANVHTVMSSPAAEGFEKLLATCGATRRVGVFALARILDVEKLWRTLAPRRSSLLFESSGGRITLHASGAHERSLSHTETLELFFGDGCDSLPGLPRAERRELTRTLPWPLYLWGLDSI